MMEICEKTDYWPDYTYPIVMENYVNKNLDDVFRKVLNEISEIVVNEDGGEKKLLKTKM